MLLSLYISRNNKKIGTRAPVWVNTITPTINKKKWPGAQRLQDKTPFPTAREHSVSQTDILGAKLLMAAMNRDLQTRGYSLRNICNPLLLLLLLLLLSAIRHTKYTHAQHREIFYFVNTLCCFVFNLPAAKDIST